MSIKCSTENIKKQQNCVKLLIKKVYFKKNYNVEVSIHTQLHLKNISFFKDEIQVSIKNCFLDTCVLPKTLVINMFFK